LGFGAAESFREKGWGTDMKIAVLVKQVPDTATRIALKPDASDIDASGIKWVMNPYDEFAVEEALKLRDQHGGEVVLFTLGPARVEETIRQGLAMGADRAVAIDDAGLEGLDHLGVARVLSSALAKEGGLDLVLAGKQAVDDDAAQVAPLVAAMLDWPQVMVVLALNVDPNARRITATRELEGATETVDLPLPAVVGAQRGLNTPRYPTLPNIMKAKRKEVARWTTQDLGLDPAQLRNDRRVEVLGYEMPPPRPEPKVLTGDPVEAAKTLVQLLHSEAKII
jgi:electron transfer flavoprotein beta subunit